MNERLFVRLAEDPLQGRESDVPAATLQVLPVHRALQARVAQVLGYGEDFAPGHEVIERVLPDGSARLLVHLSGGATNDAPFVALAGASARPALVRLGGRMRGLSVTLRPGATAALFGVPAAELAERVVPLDDLWPGAGRCLLDQLMARPALDAAAGMLQHALWRQARACDAGATVSAAVRAIQAGQGRTRPRELAAALGMGERRLQQLFREQVGLTPKALSRLARLHALLRALRHTASPAWAQLAPELGFSDQSHLVNEFRALSGLTPGQFVARRVVSESCKPTR